MKSKNEIILKEGLNLRLNTNPEDGSPTGVAVVSLIVFHGADTAWIRKEMDMHEIGKVCGEYLEQLKQAGA